MVQSAYKTLIVDDEPEVRRLVERALTRHGFACDTAIDGEDALDRCHAQQYDLVLTDLRMPRRHGHSLIMELIQQANHPRLVVLTAVAEPRLVRDLLSRGVDEVLTKPINFDVLAMKLLSIFERQQWLGESNSPAKSAKRATSRLQILGKIESTVAELTQMFADRLGDIFAGTEELPEAPKAVKNLIDRLEKSENDASVANPGHFSRKKERACVSAAVVAVPVDRHFVQHGEAFRATIRDISESGARLLHTRATNTDFLAMSWMAETIPYTTLRVPARVMRCRPQSPFYDVGCQFVMAD